MTPSAPTAELREESERLPDSAIIIMPSNLPVFHECWYSDEQLDLLVQAYESVRNHRGSVLEIGCWEGRSTVALARACYPDCLLAIDTWRGNQDEDQQHISVQLARQRDIFATFLHNVQVLTDGNVQPVRRDCHAFLKEFAQLVKFCHIDASHDYLSVKRTIEVLLPKLITGAVLCGDDFMNAHASRDELQGGVGRAVRESLPGFIARGNFWYWRKTKNDGLWICAGAGSAPPRQRELLA